MINPELQLEHGERAQLAAITAMEGYKILHRIMRSEVDKFFVALINAKPGDSKSVIASHLLAKAAAQFYQAVTNRINEEVTQYTAAPKVSDMPVDVTEGLLDLGDIAEQLGVGVGVGGGGGGGEEDE